MAKPPTFEPPPKRDPSPVFWKCQRCKVWVDADNTVVATAGPFKGERLCRPCHAMQETPYE